MENLEVVRIIDENERRVLKMEEKLVLFLFLTQKNNLQQLNRKMLGN